MDPLTLALIAAGGKALIGGIKAIAGGVQKRRANKALESEMPKYSRPEEYDKLLGIFQQQAGLGQLPGQDQIEAKLSSTTARGTRAVAKYADNPVAAVAATAGLYGREQGAIRDLGIQFAEFRNRAQGQLANAYKIGADYADKEWSYNEFYPDQVKRNMAAQRWNAGQANLWGGIDMVAGAGMDALTAGINAQQGTPQQAPSSAGIQTDPKQTSWMQGTANAASIPMNAGAAVAPGTYQDFSSLYNPTYAAQFIPSLATPVPGNYYTR